MRTKGGFSLALASDPEVEEVQVTVGVVCVPVEDQGLDRADLIPVSLTLCGKRPDPDSTSLDGEITLSLRRGEKPTFRFLTDPYGVDWTTQVEVLVTEFR